MTSTQGKIRDICERLTEAFCAEVPLRPTPTKGKKAPSTAELTARSESGLKRFYDIARAESAQHQLGVIGKARVAFGVQQQLLTKEYPPALVKQVLFAMLTSSFIK